MTGRPDPDPVYCFDRFCLDTARGTLQDHEENNLPLRPKAYLLLCHLLEHPGRLHRREELLEALWQGVIVTDDSLTQCVSDLRRVLGDRADHVLKTLPRRGYVLCADVERRSSRSSIDVPVPPPGGAQITASPSYPDIEAVRCALVLMERPQGRHGDANTMLAEEFENDLFMYLTRFEGLRVVDAATGSQGEGYRVRSEVKVAGLRLHCAVLLEDAQTGAVLWAEQHDQSFVDRASLVELLIMPLATRIDQQVATESRRRARQKPVQTLSARELCLLAGDHHQRGSEADTAIAHDLLEQAIALDPNYAAAYAWQSYVVQRGFTFGWGRLKGDAARHEAMALARRGAVLAPYSPLCLARLAWCLLLCQHDDEAVTTARMALSGTRAPGISVRITCSEVLAHAGYAREAVEQARRTLQLDPYCQPTVYAALGRSLLFAGEPEPALSALRICAARLPDYASCYHFLLVAAHETGHVDEARHALAEIQRLQPGWRPPADKGQWSFFGAQDDQRLQAAFDAARIEPLQQSQSGADVLSFRSREKAT